MFEQNQKIKLGLALSGGAALGNVHIGVLQALQDHQIPIEYISGTSAGAMVAACYAFGVPIDQMQNKTKSLNWFNLSAFPKSPKGLISTKGVGELVEEVIGRVNIEEAKIPLAIVATDIESGQPVVFTKGNLSQAIQASICIPGLFEPVQIGEKQLVDGGLVENLPISPLYELGAKKIIAVNLARHRKYKKPSNVIDVLLNTLDIMTHVQSNQNAKRADVLIEPHLQEYSTSDFKKSAELIAEGYRSGSLAIPKIKALLESPPKLHHEDSHQTWLEKIIRWIKN